MTGPVQRIRIGSSPLHGRGVFATREIRTGTTILRSPVLVTEEPGDLEDYVFEWGSGKCALALGPLSLCNHSRKPNAEVQSTDDELIVIALRRIRPGEEILVDYGPDHLIGSLP